jgi:hypothetical protein
VSAAVARVLGAAATLVFTAACGAVDLEAERQALLAQHEVDKQAHLDGLVEPIMASIGDELITVYDGRVATEGRDEIETFFSGYLAGARYSEYADIDPPIVRVSRDGTTAWMIVRQRIRRTEPDSAGTTRERAFIYAGIMTYEKRDGRWTKVANVSTFERPAAASE